LWFAKTLADCKINRIAAAVSPAFCYNFSHVALCQSLFRNGGSPVSRATKSPYRESRFASTTRRDHDWHLDTDARAAIDQILRRSIPNPIGPEFMAPPARNTVAA
jgi:hypothetical protein